MITFPTFSDSFPPACQSLIRVAEKQQRQAEKPKHHYVRIYPQCLDVGASQGGIVNFMCFFEIRSRRKKLSRTQGDSTDDQLSGQQRRVITPRLAESQKTFSEPPCAC